MSDTRNARALITGSEGHEEIRELSKREMEAAEGGASRLAAGGASRTQDHKIDLSVCDLETFDFDKCLG